MLRCHCPCRASAKVGLCCIAIHSATQLGRKLSGESELDLLRKLHDERFASSQATVTARSTIGLRLMRQRSGRPHSLASERRAVAQDRERS